MATLSNKQKKSFLESNAKINIWEGAVRSGKTFASLIRFLEELRKGPEGEYALICRTYDAFKRNVLPQLCELVGTDVKYLSGKRELEVFNDRKVHVIGADDERAEAKLRGPTFSGAYVDEVTIIPESVFKMLISRCAMRGAKIFATTNPDSPFHWLKRDFLDNNPDVASWQFTLDDNPELTSEDKEYLKRQYTGLWNKRFIQGLWVQAEGAVYDFFDSSTHCVEWPPWPPNEYVVGVDYGTTNPTSFILIGIDKNHYSRIFVTAEYFYDSKANNRQKTDSEYADDLLKFISSKPISSIYIDPSAASFRVELMKRGVQGIKEANNEVVNGIRFVSKMLSDGTVKICRSCPQLIREFHSYVWDEKSLRTGIDKPLKVNDHCLDALRYGLFTHFYGRGSDSPRPEDWDRWHNEVWGNNQYNFPPQLQQPTFY